MRQLILFAGLFLSLTTANAQKLQLGLGVSLNGTFFHKGESTYDDYYFESKPRGGIGLSIPCHIKLNEYLTIRTGIGFQNKKYHFEQNKFDFPNVVDKSGSFYFQLKFTSLEVPLLICFSPSDNRARYKIEYKLGCILTHNTPKVMTAGVEDFKYNGSDSVNYLFAGTPPTWTNYFSPDIYAGISLIKTKENLRRHELTLSYQYSFTPSTRVEFSSSLWTASLTKEYNSILKPTLSYIALTYLYYPKWLSFIKGKKG